MRNQELSRRTLLKGGGAAVAGLSALQVAGPAHAFPGGDGEEVIPWLDQPPAVSLPGRRAAEVGEPRLLPHVPPTSSSSSATIGTPAVDAATWRLGIGGLVARPLSLSLD